MRALSQGLNVWGIQFLLFGPTQSKPGLVNHCYEKSNSATGFLKPSTGLHGGNGCLLTLKGNTRVRCTHNFIIEKWRNSLSQARKREPRLCGTVRNKGYSWIWGLMSKTSKNWRLAFLLQVDLLSMCTASAFCRILLDARCRLKICWDESCL